MKLEGRLLFLRGGGREGFTENVSRSSGRGIKHYDRDCSTSEYFTLTRQVTMFSLTNYRCSSPALQPTFTARSIVSSGLALPVYRTVVLLSVVGVDVAIVTSLCSFFSSFDEI